MYTIQAADCEGTVLTTAATGEVIEHLGTVTARLLEVKTGLAPSGQRNRVLTFVVDGPSGVRTYTRAGGEVIDDATGSALRPAVATVVACGLCGEAAVVSSRVRTEAGTTEVLCRDCRELDLHC